MKPKLDNPKSAEPDPPAFLRQLAAAPPKPRRESLALAVGTQLGDFRLDERIGRGGMGTVYKAWDTRLQRPVAIKVLRRNARDDAARARLLREAQALAAAAHPNVAAVHQVVDEADRSYLVMELVAGRSLRELYDDGPIPFRRAFSLLQQLLSAVAHLHRAQVTHCDLKPENVMVADSGALKLVDFGLASDGRLSLGGWSQRGAGTPQYIAPEQQAGDDADARADVFALGVMIDELLGHTERTVAQRRRVARLKDIARRSRAERRDDRPRDADALLSEATALHDTSRRWWATAAVAVSLLAAAGAWYRSAQRVPALPLLFERRLTYYPQGVSIASAALSPDATRLATVRGGSLIISSTASAEPGSTLSVPGGAVVTGAEWVSADELLVVTRNEQAKAEAHRVTLDGHTRPVEIPHGLECRVARASGRVACFDAHHLSVGGLDGRPWAPALLRPEDFLYEVVWSPAGDRLALMVIAPGRDSASLETLELATGRRTVILDSGILAPAGSVPAVAWPRADRLLYVGAEPDPNVLHTHLWAQPIDPVTSLPSGSARKLHTWVDSTASRLSVSDTGALAYVRASTQDDIYVGDLDGQGAELSGVSRFTPSERNERPSGWLGDELLYTSDLGGPLRIFRQRIGGVAAALAPPQDMQTWPVATPDGSAVLFWRTSPGEKQSRLMRRSLADGGEKMLLALPFEQTALGRRPPPLAARVQCPRSSDRCVLSRMSEAGAKLSWLDPTGSRPEEPFLSLSFGDTAAFDFDARGERVAVAHDDLGVDVRRVDGTLLEHWSVPDGCLATHVAWSATGTSLFVAGDCAEVAQLFVLESGRPARSVYSDATAWFGHPTPSPDGRHLAFHAKKFETNAWLLPQLP